MAAQKLKIPFAHLNLRFNPFGELDRCERQSCAVVEVSEVEDFLCDGKKAVQFLGDHGRGKSTHLLALHASFPQAAYCQFYPSQAPSVPKNKQLFLDSVDQLSVRRRRRVFKAAQQIALTTHQDLKHELQSAGFDVMTKAISQTHEDRVAAIMQRRVEFARRDAGAVPEIQVEHARRLMTLFGDDIRAMEGHLYHVFQDLGEIDNVQV